MTLISVRSLLDGSDTISIDTAMVSSQEFGCLLDMVYTGKLPIGKHNVSRIVSAADSLQMFDVAVGFKNVLTSLVNQQPPVPVPVPSTQAANTTVLHKAQSLIPEDPASPNEGDSTSDKMETIAELKREDCPGDSEDAEEAAYKRACVELSESSGQFQITDYSVTGLIRGLQTYVLRAWIHLDFTSLSGSVQYNNTVTVLMLHCNVWQHFMSSYVCAQSL